MPGAVATAPATRRTIIDSRLVPMGDNPTTLEVASKGCFCTEEPRQVGLDRWLFRSKPGWLPQPMASTARTSGLIGLRKGRGGQEPYATSEQRGPFLLSWRADPLASHSREKLQGLAQKGSLAKKRRVFLSDPSACETPERPGCQSAVCTILHLGPQKKDVVEPGSNGLDTALEPPHRLHRGPKIFAPFVPPETGEPLWSG
jgi:hypothetical protein